MTGGIGGVHRGAETTMDISADLTELGRYRISKKSKIKGTVSLISCDSPCKMTKSDSQGHP